MHTTHLLGGGGSHLLHLLLLGQGDVAVGQPLHALGITSAEAEGVLPRTAPLQEREGRTVHEEIERGPGPMSRGGEERGGGGE